MTAILDSIASFFQQTGFSYLFTSFMDGGWKTVVMLLISFVLLFLAIVKKFEPLLLLPIAFGMLLTNLPMAELYHPELFAGGHVHWDLFGGATIINSTGISQELLSGAFGQCVIAQSGDVFIGNVLLGHVTDLATISGDLLINAAGQIIDSAGKV